MTQVRKPIKNHLSIKEVKDRYKKSTNREKERWQILLILMKDQACTYQDVAEIVSYSPSRISEIVTAYNKNGPKALIDGRSKNQSSGLLSKSEQLELKKLLESQLSPDGGLWDGPKVAQWISAKKGEKVSVTTAYNYMTKLGFTKKKPRPSHEKSATPGQQKKFKKSLKKSP